MRAAAQPASAHSTCFCYFHSLQAVWLEGFFYRLLCKIIHTSRAAAFFADPPQSAASGAAAPQTITANFGGLLGLHYSPNTIFIHPGDTLDWNGDFTLHPLVSDETLWTQVSTGTDFAFQFNTPGVYHFHCFFHGAFGMTGTVFVGFQTYIPDVSN
jgi:plastocyanin